MNTIRWQILWAIGCIFWNLYGLYLIQQGRAPIGPTATAAGAVMVGVFAILFWWLPKQGYRWPYVGLSALAGLMAAWTIYGAFTKDPSLWPSEAWRWAGIVLNGIGVVSCLSAVWCHAFKPSKGART